MLEYPIEYQDFDLFGSGHLTALGLIALASIGLPLVVRRVASEDTARRIGLWIAAFVVVQEIVRTWLWVGLYGSPWVLHLPLQLCSISVFLSAAVLACRTPRIYELLYFWGLAGGLQALLTPDVPGPFPHVLTTGFYVSHGLIMVGIGYATIVDRMRPTARSIPRVFAATLLFAGIVGGINRLLGTNYMYLCEKPPTASLLDQLGPWPWYIATGAVVALGSYVVVYLPWWIRDLVAGSSEDDTAKSEAAKSEAAKSEAAE